MTPTDRTHGRWPWAAAAAAAPATALASPSRAWLADELRWTLWLPLPVLFWHQTEEWVWPGGFLPWMNREVIGSRRRRVPDRPPRWLVINTGVGWALCGAAIVAGPRRPATGATVLSLLLGNAAMHLGIAARTRRRNPGAVTSALLLAPLGAAGLRALARDERVPSRQVVAGALAGVAGSVGMMAAMKARLAADASLHDRPRAEQARVVRDHARDAERFERADARRLVDGPHVQLAARLVDRVAPDACVTSRQCTISASQRPARSASRRRGRAGSRRPTCERHERGRDVELDCV